MEDRLAQILFDQHTVHGGRCTEGGDIVLCKHGQNLFCVKPIQVINQDSTFTQPLTVELAPASFILAVNFFRNPRLFGHLLCAVAQNLTHTSDTGCNVHKLCGRICVGHGDSPF